MLEAQQPPMMRHQCGSTHRYVLSSDLEPGAGRGRAAASSGPTGQQQGNVQDSHHISTQLPVTTHPHRLVGSPQKLIEISSIGGMTGPQQIGVPHFLDPQQSHKTFMSGFKAPTVCAGIPASNKQHPQQGLVQASLPFKLERHPTSRAASPGPGVKHRDQVTMADRPIGAP